MTKQKLAIFVEGYTEQLFFKHLIEHLAQLKSITFDIQVSTPTSNIVLLDQTSLTQGGSTHHIIIHDCTGDSKVKSAILDNRDSLHNHGFSEIFGVYDLYPKTLADLPAVKAYSYYGIDPAGKPPVSLFISVHEPEAWFLQDHTHYNRINARLNVNNFKRQFGFDPKNDLASNVPHPAILLDQIYRSVGEKYIKRKDIIKKTVEAIDYEELHLIAIAKLPDLADIIGKLEDFLNS